MSVPRRQRRRYAGTSSTRGRLSASAFDEAYTVARLTPGTNLLAMYTLLGERFAGWKGALGALTVGAFIPALIAVALSAAYVGYAGQPLAQAVMQGAGLARSPCSRGQS